MTRHSSFLWGLEPFDPKAYMKIPDMKVKREQKGNIEEKGKM